MKLFLIIPDGTGIRNFLCSRFLNLLVPECEVVVWHSLPEAFLDTFRERWRGRVRFLPLPTFREGAAERVLRSAKLQAQLYWHNDPALDMVLRRYSPGGRVTNRIIGHCARLLGRVSASGAGIQSLDKLHVRATRRAPYMPAFLEVLSAEKPDCVFCTHQRASRAVPAMLAARELGIPTATFIYSWDNLPKGRMAVHADHYLVWSDTMRGEMRRYYPEVESRHIHVVGTPQFEFYADRSVVEPRREFLRSVGLSPDRPVICFSGDDVTTSPFDPIYLRDIAVALREFPKTSRPQLLFRPCPADNSNRYSRVLREFPEVVISRPKWQACDGTDWTQIVPTTEDIALLVNIATHCELVVNVGSTMAVDFAICGNPAMYLAYNPPEAVTDGWRVERIYQLPHFENIHLTDSVYWASSRQEIAPLIRRILENPQEKAGQREALIRRIAQLPLAGASRRSAEALYRIMGKSAAICTSAF